MGRLVLLFHALLPFALAQTITTQYQVFSQLSEGYMTFRIPCIVSALNGTLLAFAEGRVATNRPPIGNSTVCYGSHASYLDHGCHDKDIVLKKSYDSGRSWTNVISLTRANKTFFYSNENAAMDPRSGTIYLQYSRCSVATGYRDCRNVVVRSKDNGETFSGPSVHGRGLGGPAGGWVVRRAGDSSWQGRIIMPQYYYGSLVLYSDDEGITWKSGNNPINVTNENGIAETGDGSLMMYSRVTGSYQPRFFRSSDGGINWVSISSAKALSNSDCEMSLTSFITPDQTVLLLSHPNTNIEPEPMGRQNMTVHVSLDDGINWNPIVQIYEGPSAYSSIIQINSTTAAVLYERSPKPPPVNFESIYVAFFSINTAKQIKYFDFSKFKRV